MVKPRALAAEVGSGDLIDKLRCRRKKLIAQSSPAKPRCALNAFGLSLCSASWKARRRMSVRVISKNNPSMRRMSYCSSSFSIWSEKTLRFAPSILTWSTASLFLFFTHRSSILLGTFIIKCWLTGNPFCQPSRHQLQRPWLCCPTAVWW